MSTAVAVGQVGYLPVSRKQMPLLVEQEHARQMSWFKATYVTAAVLSGGMPLQAIYDAGTPSDGRSYHAVAAALVSEDWKRNEIWLLSCRPTAGKKDADMALDVQTSVEAATGAPFAEAVGSCMQDGGAQSENHGPL